MRIPPVVRRLLPRRVKPHRIWSGPLRGRRIVTSWRDYPAAVTGRTELPLLRWFHRHVRTGETWLDVGAHFGYTALALSELVGPGGRVFAFEPMMSTAGSLLETREANGCAQLTVLPLGLAAAGRLELADMPSVRGMVDSTLTAQSRDQRVLVASLDWLWPMICGAADRIDGIKVDVQGMELEVLRGSVGVLERFHPRLVIELHRGVDRMQILDLVERVGYSSRATPIEPQAGETTPSYLDDRSYVFTR